MVGGGRLVVRVPGWWWLVLGDHLVLLGGFLARVLAVRYRPPDPSDEG